MQALRNDLTQARSSYQKALAIDPSKAKSTKALNQLNKLVALSSDQDVAEPDVVPASYSIGDRN